MVGFVFFQVGLLSITPRALLTLDGCPSTESHALPKMVSQASTKAERHSWQKTKERGGEGDL